MRKETGQREERNKKYRNVVVRVVQVAGHLRFGFICPKVMVPDVS